MANDPPIRVAAVQIAPDLETAGGTVSKVLAAIGEAAEKGARLVIFPETFIPWYPYFSFVLPPVLTGAEHIRLYENAVVVPGPVTEAVAAAARRNNIVVVLGVNERDHGSLYNTQLVFDADGRLVLKRRKITPTFHERMIWGQGDGSGLRAVDSRIGRIGQLACFEHYNPLARYAMMADGEQIHSAMFPGSMFGDGFAERMEIAVRQHALEAGCFVVCATAWLDPDQQALIAADTGITDIGPISGGCFTAVIAPDGSILGQPIRSGEGEVIVDLDFTLIDKRKHLVDTIGHYSRPELLSLLIDRTPAAHLHDRDTPCKPGPQRGGAELKSTL